MDWIEKLNEALDYIEANLDGEIDVGLAAKRRFVLPFISSACLRISRDRRWANISAGAE